MRHDWTEDRIAIACDLWKSGLSASAIARRMGGISRGSILGKLYRLGLLESRKKSAAERTRRKISAGAKRRWALASAGARAQRGATPPALPSKPLPPEPPAPAARMIPLADLEAGDCRFPYGDGPFLFCGCARAPGLPYCATHARVAYQPVAARRSLCREAA
jgi:GcrA cell cycle regulator